MRMNLFAFLIFLSTVELQCMPVLYHEGRVIHPLFP